jgi:hypothetical protein
VKGLLLLFIGLWSEVEAASSDFFLTQFCTKLTQNLNKQTQIESENSAASNNQKFQN